MNDDTTRVFELTLTGQLSLDFVNTLDWRESDHANDFINTYSDLVLWGQHAKVLTKHEARNLLREAERSGGGSASALEGALLLRETLFRVFSAIIDKRRPKKSDLDFFNGKLAEAFSHLRVAPAAQGFALEWESNDSSGDQNLNCLMWSITRAACELLTSADVSQLRRCAGEGCGWLFLDTSRNQSRRWCYMSVCGNRAKARRFYRQVKASR